MGDHLQIRTGNFAGVIRPEHLFARQSPACDPLGEHMIHPLRYSLLDTPSHVKDAVLQQSDEAAPKAEEVRGTNYESLHELIELADGAEFGRDLQQLMEFVGLGAGSAVELGISDGDRAEAGNC